MNFKTVTYTLGWVLNIEGVCMLLPLICSLLYGDGCEIVFCFCIVLCFLAGLLLTLKPPKGKAIYSREGFSIVALSWIVLSVVGALPFYISRFIPSFTDALFETVSGFTTTGATLLENVEALPESLLFWRSFTHWIGGMGVLVFAVAVLPLAGGSNLYLIKAESPGPSVSKIVPKVRTNAKILYGIYILLTVLQIIFLLFGKMNLFDALTTAFATAGTGGFATRNSSMADFSPYIQVVTTVFMTLFGVNFSLYYLMLAGRFKEAFSSTELKTYIAIIAVSIALICFNCRHLFASVSETLRHSAFQVASIITTTGFATTDFDKWPELSKTVLVTLMFIGACAGSTGGGIKVSRIIILMKSIVKEIKVTAHPKITHKITLDSRTVEHETVRGINVFMAAYLTV